MKVKILIFLAIPVLVGSHYWRGYVHHPSDGHTATVAAKQSQAVHADNTALETAFRNRARNVWVEGAGEVAAVLADDNQGARHQRFILKLDNGISLLFAHNIDLAPPIRDLRKGETVVFRGEYIYNTKGGIVHWTHHDPQGRHPGGWLKYRGETYQ